MSAEGHGRETAAAGRPGEGKSGTFTGGCACCTSRYTCSSEALLAFNCHCYECQKVSGSAFTSLMIVPGSDFELLQGEPRYYASPANSGYFLQRGFCPIAARRYSPGKTTGP